MSDDCPAHRWLCFPLATRGGEVYSNILTRGFHWPIYFQSRRAYDYHANREEVEADLAAEKAGAERLEQEYQPEMRQA